MAKGKNKCRILKEIRKQIAEANDIEFLTEECRYKGDCLGTCPKCEAEVRYLEEQLQQRSKLGKAVAVVGVSLGLSLSASAMSLANAQELPQVNDSTPQVQQDGCTIPPTKGSDGKTIDGKYRIKGKVVDGENEPLIGMSIRDSITKTATFSNIDGYFEFCTDKEEVTLTFIYIGYKTKEITFKREDYDNIKTVVFEDDDELMMGEVVVMQKRPLISRILTGKKYKMVTNFKEVLVKGLVVDKDNNPLPGVDIVNGRKNLFGTSDTDGEFKFNYNTTKKKIKLTFSLLGFKSKTITIKEKDFDESLTIVMEEDDKALKNLKQNWAY